MLLPKDYEKLSPEELVNVLSGSEYYGDRETAEAVVRLLETGDNPLM